MNHQKLLESDLRMQMLEGDLDEEYKEDRFQLLYVVSGQIDITVDKNLRRMPEGEIMLISPSRHYFIRNAQKALYLLVGIPLSMCSQIRDAITREELGLSKYRIMVQCLHKMAFAVYQMPASESFESKWVYEYLSAYNQMISIFVPEDTEVSFGSSDSATSRKYLIDQYVQQNYDQPISLSSLAERIHMSEGYLSRYFRKIFGEAFQDYVKKIRLIHAREQILNTEDPITRIAFDNGFSGESYFAKAYKSYFGETPSVTRESAKTVKGAELVGDIANDRKRLSKVVHVLEQQNASNSSFIKDIDIYCKKTGNKINHHPWSMICNAGPAQTLLSIDYQKLVTELIDQLKFTHIRIWNLFSSAMLMNINVDNGNYNFKRLDTVIDFILSCGAKPFLDMEEKERTIHRRLERDSSKETLSVQKEEVVFESVEQWERVIGSVFAHLERRYGKETLADWYFEVWYDGYKLQGVHEDSAYYTLFSSLYRIAKATNHRIKVGGCGIYPGFINKRDSEVNFWKEWKRKAPKPDFVSTIVFAYDADENNIGKEVYVKKSADFQYMRNYLTAFHKDLEDVEWDTIPIIVTEWNRTISDREMLNDHCFQGTYMIQALLGAVDYVEGIGYYSGADYISDDYDSGKLLCGATGLISNDGIMKPSAYALDFLNRCYTYMVLAKEDILVTTDRNEYYSVLCHNGKELSLFYYKCSEDEITHSDIEQCFIDKDASTFHLHFYNTENGVYVFKQFIISEERGSVYDAWKRWGYYENLTEEDLLYLRNECLPQVTVNPVKAENCELHYTITLPANAFAYIQIVRRVE